MHMISNKLETVLIVLGFVMGFSVFSAVAATPGIPFKESFDDTDLRSSSETNTDWRIESSALQLRQATQKSRPTQPSANTTTHDLSSVSDACTTTVDFDSGDVDGNGYTDIIIAKESTTAACTPGSLLYFNDGTGFDSDSSTPFPVRFSVTQNVEPRRVYLRDFTNDGHIDVFFANGFFDGSGEQHKLYVNDGSDNPYNTSAQNKTPQAVGAPRATYDLVVGDFDGDGDIDFIEAEYDRDASVNQSARQLYLNNGSGTPFDAVVPFSIDPADENNPSNTANSDSFHLVAGDLDSDGDLDLIESSSSSNNGLFVYYNNGTTNPFLGVSGIEVGPGLRSFSLAVADMDGDGDIDIIDDEGILLNNGTATPFSDAKKALRPSACESNPWSVSDYNGDGAMDLILSRQICYNNGTPDPFQGVLPVLFTQSSIISSSGWANSVIIDDFDKNGDADILKPSGASFPDRVIKVATTENLFSNTDTATFVLSSFNRTIEGGDFNQDGKPDYLYGASRFEPFTSLQDPVGTPFDNKVVLNTGTSFSSFNIGSTNLSTTASAVADFDGDGDLDFVEGNSAVTLAEFNRLFLNDGDNEGNPFTTSPIIIGNALRTSALASADIDHDGDADLIEADADLGIHVFLNNGTSSPFTGVIPSLIYSADNYLEVDSPPSLVFGDINRDGLIDMASARVIFINNGTDNPYNSIQLAATGTERYNYTALGDLNGDGYLDWVRGSGDFNNDRVLYNTQDPMDPFGGATVQSLPVPPSTSLLSKGIKLRDFNLDGKLDIYTISSSGGLLRLNNGTDTPFAGVSAFSVKQPNSTTQASDRAEAFVVADFNLDGSPDVIQAAARVLSSSTNGLVPRSGHYRSFGTPRSSNLNSFRTVGVVEETVQTLLVDVNRDGALDLIDLSFNGVFRTIINNKTTQPFSAQIDSTATGQNSTAMLADDFNYDGITDLIVTNSGTTNTQYYFGEASSSMPFSSLSKYDITNHSNSGNALTSGDFDGDGKVDLIVGNQSGTNRLYFNTGTNQQPFNFANSFELVNNEATSVLAAADVDNDGDLDLIEGANNSPIQVFLSNGTSSPFNGVTAIQVGSAQNVTSLAVADVDNDGDIDIVDGSETGQSRLFRNNGTANPFDSVAAIFIGETATHTSQVTLADVDGNGWLDLLEANTNAPNRLFLNDRDSNPFNNSLAIEPVDSINDSSTVVTGDVDRDGTLDIIFGKSTTSSRLYQAKSSFETVLVHAGSLEIDSSDQAITELMLASNTFYPDNNVDTRVDFYLSNDDGLRWSPVEDAEPTTFQIPGNKIRWRAEIYSLTSAQSPVIHQLEIGGDTDDDGLFDPIDPDDDNDNVSDEAEIAAGLDPLDNDSDGDGVLDGDEDLDNDGLTNAEESVLGTDLLEPDTDEDGVNDNLDDFPLDENEDTDTDMDGIGDNSDPDIDDDTILNEIDNCPFHVNLNQDDRDDDGVGDACSPNEECTFFIVGAAVICL